MSNLADYKKFMLIQENIANFLPYREEENLKRFEKKDNFLIKNNFNMKNKSINETDQLFWCFYIILKG